MNTRSVFSPSDFKSCGQYVVKDTFKRGDTNFQLASSVAYKVGWQSHAVDKTVFFLVAVTDGMCIGFDDLDALCRYLNKDTVGFRPLEDDELVEVMKATGNRFFR